MSSAKSDFSVERLEVGPLQTNCYIIRSGEELAVVDPGGDGPDILRRLAELGGTVRFVINTHGHVDHVAADAEIIGETGAELLIHPYDGQMLLEPDRNLSVMMGHSVRAPEASRFVVEGDVIKVGEESLRVVHTPGHTPGGICLIGRDCAFTGDTLFLDSIGRVDFPGGDERAMRSSLARLGTMLSRQMMLYPGHGPLGTFGRALLVNPFLGGIWVA
ncbi:MAG: MBL fold metallo-hydrolase [candidate division WOR-3 bacterium]